jgi:hypothetical protein
VRFLYIYIDREVATSFQQCTPNGGHVSLMCTHFLSRGFYFFSMSRYHISKPKFHQEGSHHCSRKNPIHLEKPKSHESTFRNKWALLQAMSTQPSNPSWHFVEFLTLYSKAFLFFFLSCKAWFAIVPMSFAHPILPSYKNKLSMLDVPKTRNDLRPVPLAITQPLDPWNMAHGK